MRTIAKFFEDVTGLVPTDNQKELLHHAVQIKPSGRTKYNKIIISAGRQSGKTLCSAVVALWFVFEWAPENRTIKIILLSAQDNILYFHMREIFKKHPEFTEKLSEQSKLAAALIPMKGFETAQGSVVFVKKATEKQVLGTPADIVFIDEACKVKDEIVEEAFGNITGDIAKMIMLSTPDVDNSYMVRTMNDTKDRSWKIFMWEAEKKDCPWHNEEIEKEKKHKYSKQLYATQVLGRPKKEEERTFFPSKHLNACVFEEDTSRVGGAKSTLESGIDWGFNTTAFVVRERIGPTKTKVIFIKVYKKVPIEEIAPDIAHYLNIFKPEVNKADSKPSQFQGWVEKFTKRKIHYIDASDTEVVDGKEITHKAHMLGQLLRRVKEHQLVLAIPACAELVEEMKAYRRHMRDGDDRVDALALACYEPSTPLVNEKVTMHFGNRKIIFSKQVDKYGFKKT